MLDFPYVKNSDPEVYEAMQQELGRQQGNLELIASENVVLELSDPTRPGLFLPFESEDKEEDLLMLLMPMMV